MKVEHLQPNYMFATDDLQIQVKIHLGLGYIPNETQPHQHPPPLPQSPQRKAPHG